MCSTNPAQSRWSPHPPDDPAWRNPPCRWRRWTGSKAGGLLPRSRGRQSICDAAAGVAAKRRASAAFSAAGETSAIVASQSQNVRRRRGQEIARRQDSRPDKSQNVRQSNERPQNAKPAMFQTSVCEFSTTQRPLIKSSGSQRFPRRRRYKIIHRRRSNHFSFPNCDKVFPAASCPLWHNTFPRQNAHQPRAAISAREWRRTVHSSHKNELAARLHEAEEQRTFAGCAAMSSRTAPNCSGCKCAAFNRKCTWRVNFFGASSSGRIPAEKFLGARRQCSLPR